MEPLTVHFTPPMATADPHTVLVAWRSEPSYLGLVAKIMSLRGYLTTHTSFGTAEAPLAEGVVMDFSYDMVRHNLDASDVVAVAVNTEGQPRAFAAAQCDGDVLFVRLICSRRRGQGRRLMAQMALAAQTTGRSWLGLDACRYYVNAEHTQQLQGFYERLGFAPCGAAGHDDNLPMRLKLHSTEGAKLLCQAVDDCGGQQGRRRKCDKL